MVAPSLARLPWIPDDFTPPLSRITAIRRLERGRSQYVHSVAEVLQPFLPGLIDDFYNEIDRHPDAKKVITGGASKLPGSREPCCSGSAICWPAPMTGSMWSAAGKWVGGMLRLAWIKSIPMSLCRACAGDCCTLWMKFRREQRWTGTAVRQSLQHVARPGFGHHRRSLSGRACGPATTQ